jgi:2-polyprenyl-3-methyl-5-hydroxy-6-metoxy-1,4-benzoquinol methylase
VPPPGGANTPEFTAEEVVARWDQLAELVAGYVSEYGDINKEVLLTPVLLDMLGDLSGKQVLDAGCGEGFLSRLMARRGASVTAVDYAGALLEIARERTPDHLAVAYLCANLERLDMLADGAFDVVVSCAVIMDLPDHAAAIGEMARLLRPGGWCLLALAHPCFSSDGAWVKDAAGSKLYWKVDNYFHERAFEWSPVPGSDHNPIGFHRTLTSYFQTIRGVGFTVEELVEPAPSPEAIEKHPRFADDLRMSHFLVFGLRKPCAL